MRRSTGAIAGRARADGRRSDRERVGGRERERIVYPVACESVNKVSARQTDRKGGGGREEKEGCRLPSTDLGREERGRGETC